MWSHAQRIQICKDTPGILYVRRKSQRISCELLNLCSHISQTLFPAREDMKVRFKTRQIWGANISLQWAGKCSTPVEGKNIYWPHNVRHHEPIRESTDGIKFLAQIPIFPQLSAYLPPKSTAIALSSDGGLSAETWSRCQIQILKYASICQVYDFMFTLRGKMEGSEREEMKDHGVCRISSGSLHFISPSAFIFLPLKWSE